MKNDSVKTTRVFDLPIFAGTKVDLIELVTERLELVDGDEPLIIFTPNPEQVLMARRDQKFAENLKQADVLIPDGSKLVDTSRWRSLVKREHGVHEKMTGRWLAEELLVRFPTRTALLIGGRGYLKVDQVKELNQLEIFNRPMFWMEGYKEVARRTPAEEIEIEQALLQMRPEMVFVAFGAPNQEAWVITHRQILAEAGVKIALVVGGSFDVLLGKLSPPPKMVEQLGLEWLYRLVQQPWRWQRQRHLIRFYPLMIQEIFR